MRHSKMAEQFSCSICLELLKDPVTIPCGHSYCMDCITDCWKEEEQRRAYSCPQCRDRFTPKPALKKNVIIAETVEKLKKNKLQTANLTYAGAGDVECDVCSGRKYKALKSCLLCLESYCQTHFEHHEALHSGKRHKIIPASGRIQDMICSKHDELLNIFCRTDKTCICFLCMMDEHKNHNFITSTSERTEKQKQLEDTQRTFQQQIQEREKKIRELKEAVQSHKSSAQTAVKDCERTFKKLTHVVEKKRSEMLKKIRDQEETEVSRAEGLLKVLKMEIDDLKKRNSELEQLSLTEDHIHFLQKFPSLQLTGFAEPLESRVVSSTAVSSDIFNQNLKKSISQLKDKIEQFCQEEPEGTIVSARNIESIYNTEPKTRTDFLKYFLQLSLDQNTVNEHLRLSEGDRVVTYTDTEQLYPDHPERFQSLYEVLCRERVRGRCYWELEWSANVRPSGVSIAVSYKTISRKGTIEECGFGLNNQSWKMYCSESSFSFWHNNKITELPEVPISSRIGVYVDERAGVLSFFSVSDTLKVLHREQTTFTQPLYAGFWIGPGSMIKILHP